MIMDDYIVTGWRLALENKMKGTDFERFCSQFLYAAGFLHADLTPYSNDDGIDILASRKDITYAIQCKRRKKPIGPGIIRSTMGSLDLYEKSYTDNGRHIFTSHGKEYEFDYAVVMTNTRFTEKAQQTADTLGILLWDRNWIEQTAQQMGILLF